MAQQDRIIEETANKRNELESYVYDMRNHLCDRLRDYISEADKTAFEAKLQETEDWLYTDEGFDSTKKVYVAKLKELTDLGEPIEFRLKQSTERPAAKSELLALVEDYKRLANTSDEAYAHWTDEDREVLRKNAADAESWIYDELSKQEALDQTKPPVLTASSIRQKAATLRDTCRAVLLKPKPKPEPTPAPEPAKTETDPNAQQHHDVPQDTEKESNDAETKMDLD